MHDTRNDLARPGVPGRPLILANGILERTSHVPHHGRQQLHRKTEFGDVYSQKLRMPVLLASAGKIKEKNAQKYKQIIIHITQSYHVERVCKNGRSFGNRCSK